MKIIETLSFGHFVFRIVYYGLSYNGMKLEIMIYRKKEYPFLSGFTVYGDYSVAIDTVQEGIKRIPELIKTERIQKLLSV